MGGTDELLAPAHRAGVGDAAEFAGDEIAVGITDDDRRFEGEELRGLGVAKFLGLDVFREFGLGGLGEVG